MIRYRDKTARLQRAMLADAISAGCSMQALGALSHSLAWCSACFDGTRHHLHFQAMPSAALDQWLGTLDTREWQVPGLLVVDLAAERDGERLILTAVTLDPDTA